MASPDRVRTGYELTVAQKTSEQFIVKAKGAGKIIDIDNKDKLIKIQYKDGTLDVLKYGDIIGSASGSHYNHSLALTDKAKLGKTVKEGTILGYHTGFFTYDPIIKEPIWNHGISANVAIVNKDVVLEDSCAISAKLADKMHFDSIYTRSIKVASDMAITSSVKIGDKVAYNTLLLRLKYESELSLPDDVDELFEDLQFVEYRAKHEGVVVDIQVYHTSDELTPSLKKYISDTNKAKRRLKKYSKDTKAAAKFSPVSKVDIDTRIHGVVLGELDVLVIFYIKSDVAMVAADKACIANQLKTVVGSVVSQPMYTESGVDVDVLFGASSAFNRVVLSCFKTGIINRVMEQAEKDILDMYFT